MPVRPVQMRAYPGIVRGPANDNKMARLLNNSKLGESGSVSDSLAAEINALHHELRRVRDGLERAGGSSHELEQRARQLLNNIQLCEAELVEIKKLGDQGSKQSSCLKRKR